MRYVSAIFVNCILVASLLLLYYQPSNEVQGEQLADLTLDYGAFDLGGGTTTAIEITTGYYQGNEAIWAVKIGYALQNKGARATGVPVGGWNIDVTISGANNYPTIDEFLTKNTSLRAFQKDIWYHTFLYYEGQDDEFEGNYKCGYVYLDSHYEIDEFNEVNNDGWSNFKEVEIMDGETLATDILQYNREATTELFINDYTDNLPEGWSVSISTNQSNASSESHFTVYLNITAPDPAGSYPVINVTSDPTDQDIHYVIPYYLQMVAAP